MRKNEAGLTILEIGDVIRKGKGKVEYTVTWVPEEDQQTQGLIQPEVSSNNTGALSRINLGNVTLVRNVRNTLGGVNYPNVKEAQEETPVKEDTSYQKAVLLALNLKGKHVYAGTVRPNVKAKRRSLNERQKASRKANR